MLQKKQIANKIKYSTEGYFYIPKKWVKYSMSLKDMLLSQLLNKKMKREDRIYRFGQDIEIFITPEESRRDAIAYVELPSRIQCPSAMEWEEFPVHQISK